MSEPLRVIVSPLANQQINKEDAWWRENRPGAPNAVREEIERISALISFQPNIGPIARNVSCQEYAEFILNGFVVTFTTESSVRRVMSKSWASGDHAAASVHLSDRGPTLRSSRLAAVRWPGASAPRAS